MDIRTVPASLILLIGLLVSGAAGAQQYPSKPITIVTSSAPGTGGDSITRVFASFLQVRLGQPVVVENRSGANQTIGARHAMAAAPDGYTLYSGFFATHPALVKNNSVDTTKEFAAVSTLLFVPQTVVTHAGLPLKSVPEVVAYSKANPGKMNYASASNPGVDLTLALIANRSGFAYTTINYKGTPDVLRSVVTGEAHVTAGGIQSFLPNIRTGKLSALMVLSQRRSPLLPDVPTSGELGLSEFAVTGGFTLWAPLATPRDIVRRLSAEVIALSKALDYIEKMTSTFGAPPVGNTPEEALRLVQQELRLVEEAARLVKYEPQ